VQKRKRDGEGGGGKRDGNIRPPALEGTKVGVQRGGYVQKKNGWAHNTQTWGGRRHGRVGAPSHTRTQKNNYKKKKTDLWKGGFGR